MTCDDVCTVCDYIYEYHFIMFILINIISYRLVIQITSYTVISVNVILITIVRLYINVIMS